MAFLNLLRSPKLIATLVVLAILSGLAYSLVHMKGRITKLVLEKAQLEADVTALEDALIVEANAARDAIIAQQAMQAALDALRSGRESDPEAQEWAAEIIPPGEIARLCEATGAEGCAN